MAPNRRSTGSRSSYSPLNEMPEAFKKALEGYSARENGMDLDSLMRHLATQDPAQLDALLAATDSMMAQEPDLATYNFSSVQVKKGAFWVMQLMPMGFQGPSGGVVDDYFEGSKPVFSIVIYDERQAFRVTDGPPEPGLPKTDLILKCIKRAIASPLPPLRPSLPEMFLIGVKFGPHVDALRPFLDSLPRGFSWRLETPEEAAEVASGVYELNVEGVAKGLASAESEKALGNAAVGRKDRAGAVEHYSEAVECLQDARAQQPTKEELKRIKFLISVCMANRAAAYLLEGDGQDPKKALKDAQEATKADEDYGKAYYRQAKAYQLLSEQDKAIDTLSGALRRPKLSKDRGLIDALVDAYGGLPDTEADLRALCIRLYKENGGDKRVEGLSGFEEKVNQQLRKVLGSQASLASL